MTAASDDENESPLAKRLRASQEKKPAAEASKPASKPTPKAPPKVDTPLDDDTDDEDDDFFEEKPAKPTLTTTEPVEDSPAEKLAKFLEQRRKERAEAAPEKAQAPIKNNDTDDAEDDLPPLKIQPSARLDALLKPKPSAPPPPPPEKKPTQPPRAAKAPENAPPPIPPQPPEPPRGGGGGGHNNFGASPAVPRPPSPFAWLFGLLFRLLLALYKPFKKYFGKPFTKLLHAVLGVAAWTGVMAFGSWGICYSFLPPFIICNKVQCYTYISKFNIFSARHWEILEKAYNYNFTIPTSYTVVGVSLALFWLVGSTWASIHGYDFFRLRRVAITLENISRSLLGLFRRR
ncbi:MAG: hypothetical protein LW855_01910 [Alphaproteobacteria bacterium]|nr:hypothetical protein [Alphaproteobacteria bacterium]